MRYKLALFCILAAIGFVMAPPASADTTAFAGSTLCSGVDNVYCNGPINGNTDAWTINTGFSVSESFTLNGPSTITGADFGVWLFPGDVFNTVDWSIDNSALFGSNVGSGTSAAVTLGPSDECNGGSCNLGNNTFGYNIESLEFSFGPGGISLGSGTYYLTLQNAGVSNGDPVYWDENGGPSVAAENSVGSIPSEAFAIDGTGGSSTPEPQTLTLIGSAALLLGGALRRKLRR